MRNVLANTPTTTRKQLERTRQLMEQVNDESLITGYEVPISSLTLPDPNDRHVLAAAIEAQASIIATFNLSDFPRSTLEAYNIEAMHPDDYLVALFDDAPELFLLSVKDHRASLKRPPKTVDDYLETLKANTLPQIAARLLEYQEEI